MPKQDPIEELQDELAAVDEQIQENESLAAPIKKILRFTIVPLLEQTTKLWIERTDELAEGLDDLEDQVSGGMSAEAKAALVEAAALGVRVLEDRSASDELKALARDAIEKIKRVQEGTEPTPEEEEESPDE